MNNKKLWWILWGGIGSAVVAIMISGWLLFGGAVRVERELFVRTQADYQMLLDSLRPELRHPKVFDIYARRMHLAETFQPGHYVITPKMGIVRVVRMLKLGRQTPVRVTIRGVRTAAQLASKLARQLDADSSAWMKAFCSDEVAKKVGFSTETLFSMFLPNTYEFFWTVTPEAFIERMRSEYDRFWTKEREAKRARSDLNRVEVMTLASIVGAETNKKDEMPRIAGVYLNRLRIGMPLQADPTVKYALQKFDLHRILRGHLQTQSPYNTYINKGLPPAPIAMPDVEAIDAVLDFEQHGYLYFCAKPQFDGYHNFARTFAEHTINARAYSAALNRRGIK